MFHYLFTNDLRISTLDSALKEAGKCFRDNCVPSANEDKNANNNMKTLGFYFDLTADSECARACASGDTRKVVINFIKKFQFPNPRTNESFQDAMNDGIILAPMRVILQTLYFLNMVSPEKAFLTKREIIDYIFANDEIAKNRNPDIPALASLIIKNRTVESYEPIPDDDVLAQKNFYWKQCRRQVREMVKVLTWAGCAVEDEKGSVRIHHDQLTLENKADLFDVLMYREFWDADPSKNAAQNRQSYEDYMDISPVSEVSEEKNDYYSNEYERAAKIINNHIEENGVSFRYNDDEVEPERESFIERFSPDKLAAIPDEMLLKTIFFSADGNNDSLCYELEFQPQIRDMFGSIAGGSSYKFGLFQRKEDGVWVTGSGIKPEELSEQQALELGKTIRDAIVTGARIISGATLDTKEDYENLDIQLNDAIGKYANYGWIQKYYHMLFPEKLANFYSSDWLNHLLYAFGIEPSEKYYGRNGQVAIVKKLTGLSPTCFADAVFDRFGQPKKFIRLGSSVEGGINAAQEWFEKSIVAIGWAELGDLDNFRQGNSLNRKALSDALKEKYYPDDQSLSSRKAGEIQEFFTANRDAIFVVMDGEKAIALVDDVGEYYYDPQNPMRAHCKPGEWHQCFKQGDELPAKSEGKLTTCFEIKKTENLMYLYKKYYYELEEVEENAMNREMPYVPINYHTGYVSQFAANRIMFGAPGTGKSYNLEQNRKEVLQGGAIGGYERVTFHPDYTYSQFVGTYKPVTDKTGNISYQFVPGPFMRVYVEALRNGRTDNPEPFILLIEEINRANVAAVFGDVFQLLDRDGSNVSEYPIQATEDIRGYLASQLGGTADNYMEIQIPDNMFIWATMNSADQGVFPMDTAFKRRWDFTYLGIDNGEDKIAGKSVVLGKGEHKRNVEWNALRKEINQVLLNDCKVNEDKLMGPFFIAMKNLPEGNEIDAESFTRIFKNKVIMYLFDDAAKQKRPTLFDGCDVKNLYSAICEEFDEKGVDIFSESVRSAFPLSADGDEE